MIGARATLPLALALAACESVPPPPFAAGTHSDAATSEVELAGACQPGDTSFCNSQGRCDAQGAGCICDDPEHYSPEDDCRNWRQYVPSGDTFCDPGDRGPCHDNGACDANGHRCVCDDAEHYTPFDDCSHRWDRAPQPPDPDAPRWRDCEPGTREHCHDRGTCNATGTGCVCDDPDHYTNDDDCNAWHQAPADDDAGGGDAGDGDARGSP